MKSPSFQFYVENFLVGTKDFTAEQAGGYVYLLCEQWDKGGLPDNDRDLLRISKMKIKALGDVKKKFKKSKKDSLLRNTRLEKERLKQKNWKKKSSLAGVKSGVVRRNKKNLVEPNANQPSNLVEPNANSLSLSSSLSTDIVVVEANNDIFFEMFRRVAGKHITDQELIQEVGKFKNKYPNAHPNKSGGLINSWVSRIGEQQNADVNPVKSRVYV